MLTFTFIVMFMQHEHEHMHEHEHFKDYIYVQVHENENVQGISMGIDMNKDSLPNIIIWTDMLNDEVSKSGP